MFPKSDLQLRNDVLHELLWDHRVRATEIGVSVDQGVVTLSGFVDSYAKKLAAQEAAHRVVGVRDVANDVEVRIGAAAARTDGAIAKAVRHALEWNVLVPDDRITSTVTDGFVTLAGTVDSLTEIDDARAAVRDLQGVKGVVNKITVRKRAVDTMKVRTSIEEALERVAEQEARKIGVTVNDHSVVLSGRVHSWQEKNAVNRVVANAEGVSSVVNYLQVDPAS
jgi:osmotically-inducible protein OsmY